MHCTTRYKVTVLAKYTSEASVLVSRSIPFRVLRMSNAYMMLGGGATVTQALIRCYNCKFQSMQK